jgi:putative DNA primase/helicase
MGDERATYPKTDTTVAITFLKALRPAGPWVLTAIWPDGPTTTESFEASDEAGATRFIKDTNHAGRNVYFTGNSCGRPGSKPKKADMTGAIMLHADSDPRDGETIDAAKKRILAAYAAHDPPPSIIVDSGNGLQGLWLLEREFVFPKPTSAPKSKAYDDEVQTRVAPVEDRNRALAVATDAPPGTHNADRLLRLPGTINFPNAKKTAQGRITRQSSIVKLTDVRYPLERFPAVGQASSKAGHGAKKKAGGTDTSRSAKAFRAGAALKAGGADYEEMRDALLSHNDPDIAEWACSKGMDNAERELRRIYDRALTAGVISTQAPYDTARAFQRGLAVPLRHHRGDFFEWNGCAWFEVEEASLRARLYAFLDQSRRKTAEGELRPVKPNAKMVADVLDALRAAAQLDASIEPPAWLEGEHLPPAHTLVACANALMHLPSKILVPHTPSFFNHNALNFDYEPFAPEPRQWLDFLNQLWGDDQQAIDTLQEIFGYCLTADTTQQKAFAVIGPKRSGKGTIARILVAMLGAHNCAAPTLAGISTNFGLAPLIGKRVAVISDARLSRRVDQHVIAERLLSITGEDAITIDRKYKSAWTGQLQTRFLILSNELFRLADASGALASRFILLMLTKSFYGQEDRNLTKKLMTELPGILNWAAAGWVRLERRGHFQQPDSAKEAVEQLEDLGSPIGAFVRECCDVGAAYSIAVDTLFLAWREWCTEQGRDRPGTKSSFGRDLKAAHPELNVTQPREEGRQLRRHYQGVRLKPETAVDDNADPV